MSKPWFRFHRGAKGHKSKEASPLGIRDENEDGHAPSNFKGGATPTKCKSVATPTKFKADASAKMKQSSISKYFASPSSRGAKRPRDDDEDDAAATRPTKKTDADVADSKRKTRDDLLAFEFVENGGIASGTAKASAKEINGADNCNDAGKNGAEKTDAEKTDSSSISKGKKTKLTPLEEQFVDIKAKRPDAILLVECGYKFRFFGDDADVAAKVLNIVSHPDHNFNTASIPTHRLFVHVRRLVAKGYKVGVVRQTETAALKANSDSKSGLFSRRLSALYTKSTLVGRDVDSFRSEGGVGDPDEASGAAADDAPRGDKDAESSDSGILMCVKEGPVVATAAADAAGKPLSTSFADVTISFVAVNPSTAKVTHDSFIDSPSRSKFETMLHQMQPVELLLPPSLSLATEKVIEKFAPTPDEARIERMSAPMADKKAAADRLSLFCKDSSSSSSLLSLSPDLQICASSLLDYLHDFGLESVFKSASASTNAPSSTLRLNAAAIRNLEIFNNLVDGGPAGTLFSVLDATKTKFGERLLRRWLAAPSTDRSVIESRLDAVEEILADSSQLFAHLRICFKGLADLERGLSTIYFKKCSVADFLHVLKAFARLRQGWSRAERLVDSSSSLIRDSFVAFEENTRDVDAFLGALDEDAVSRGDKRRTFRDYGKYPRVVETLTRIGDVEASLDEHLQEIRETLAAPRMEYLTVSGKEYLVEIRLTKAMEAMRMRVPDDWVAVQSTKTCQRFQSPFVLEETRRLAALREQLDLDVEDAWGKFLEEFNRRQFEYQRAVQSLSILDCLMSLAHVAKSRNYSRPSFVSSPPTLQLVAGRHPIVETLLPDSAQFVPNDADLSGDGRRCMIVTGPNMGGKSSFIRQAALAVVMAQTGSFVAADAARLSIFDAVFVRMGASDRILRGASTFMVELSEASEILRDASADSLVVLDELGRGTSTHDGTAIADATLRHFVETVGCLTLFVTHYPLVTRLAEKYPGIVENFHMSFVVEEEENDSVPAPEKESSPRKHPASVQMLYSLAAGKAERSFGLNVGLLAGIPAEILGRAEEKSRELEERTRRSGRLKAFQRLIKGEVGGGGDS